MSAFFHTSILELVASSCPHIVILCYMLAQVMHKHRKFAMLIGELLTLESTTAQMAYDTLALGS
eukprot:2735858-Amphidinium_carterae.1